MRETDRPRTIRLFLSLAAGPAILLAAALPCLAGAMPKQVEAELAKVRDTRAGMYDLFESSTLGKTASAAKLAATQRDLRKHYSRPIRPLDLPADQMAKLAADYGRVALFGRARMGKAFPLGITGAHVIDVEHRPELVVTGVHPNSPATRALQVGDVIIGANGRLFPKWEDPRVPIGYAIAAAQTKAFAGVLTLQVGRNGKILTVKITLAADGGYSPTWPSDCEKSKAVAASAVDYVIAHGDDTFWRDLFLLGVGDANAIAHVRDNLYKAQTSGRISGNWHGGYKLISLAEYYLLTHDPKVLPAIRAHVKGLEANQMPCGGWSHGAPGGYGVMNCVGQPCFIGLLLARECGVRVNPEVLARGVKLSGRFIGTYGAYGDHAPTVCKYRLGPPFDNGITPAHSVLFDLLGEPDVSRRSARRSCYLYRTRMGGHAEHIFSIAWSSVGVRNAPAPEFRMYADNMLWYYELARQGDGALLCLGRTRYRRSTAALGMVYTLIDKRLRITGAPRRSKPLFPVATLGEAKTPDPHSVALSRPTSVDTPAAWDTLVAATADGAGIRKSFDCGRTGYTALRVTLPVGVGGELFLNGQRVAAFARSLPSPSKSKTQTLDLGPRAAGALRKGVNVLTAKLEGGGKAKVAMELAAGPGVVENRAIAAVEPEYGNNNRNGWVGTYEQHRQGIAWAFEGMSAREVALYLAFPDWMGAQAAYKALADRGDKAVALLPKLVADSHVGIRVGAWDAVAEMNARGTLPADAKKTLSALAASRIATEDPVVGQALGRAAAPMATGEALAQILVGIAAKPDIKARDTAIQYATRGLKDHPDAMIKVLRIVASAGLDKSTIRILGGAMTGMSRNANVPAARAGAAEIARVLDEIAPDMRGMFTDGLMHGGVAVIDQHLDAELEKTPQLVSGLTRCFVKVPDTDWPGWYFASQYFRRLLYRVGPDSVPEIRRAVADLEAHLDTAHDQVAQRKTRMVEMKTWVAMLARSGGKADALRTEALRMAGSADPTERLVALSLIWPSHQTLAAQSGRYHSRQLVDTARIQDPATRLTVATKAATHVETNTPVHWLLIWQTALTYQDRPECKAILPSLAAFFDTVAYRQRGTFMFTAIDIAATIAKGQLGGPGETPQLARGLCKTYSTASNGVWYTGTRDKLHGMVKTLGTKSAPAIHQAVADLKTWLTTAPRAEKTPVLDRGCPTPVVRERLMELESIAAEPRDLPSSRQ